MVDKTMDEVLISEDIAVNPSSSYSSEYLAG